MSSLSERKAEALQYMEWTQYSLDYIYNNCDENSEFFEMVSDARLMFFQAKRAAENLLQQLPEESLSDQDTPKPRTE